MNDNRPLSFTETLLRNLAAAGATLALITVAAFLLMDFLK